MQTATVTMNGRRRQAGDLVLEVLGPSSHAPPKPKKKSTAQPRPTILVQPKGLGPIRSPNENDVLSGRGGRINAHPGNVQYRHLVLSKREAYLDEKTKKLEKAHIAAQIVYLIRSMNPPGRFLKEFEDGLWWDIGDQKAIKKVGQALREDAPNTRPDGSEESPPATKKITSKTVDKKPSPKKSLVASAMVAPEAAPSMPGRVVSARGGRGGSMMPPAINSYHADSASAIYPPPNVHPQAQQEQGKFGWRNGTISDAAAAAVSEVPSHSQAAKAFNRDNLWDRGFYPPTQPEVSMLSGTSNPSYMSGVSEISGLTEAASALSSSLMHDGGGGVREVYQKPTAPAPRVVLPPDFARNRMIRVGERVASERVDMDGGINNNASQFAGPLPILEGASFDDNSADLRSFMSHDDISTLLRSADHGSLGGASRQYLEDLSTISGQISTMSIGDSTRSTLYEL